MKYCECQNCGNYAPEEQFLQDRGVPYCPECGALELEYWDTDIS